MLRDVGTVSASRSIYLKDTVMKKHLNNLLTSARKIAAAIPLTFTGLMSTGNGSLVGSGGLDVSVTTLTDVPIPKETGHAVSIVANYAYTCMVLWSDGTLWGTGASCIIPTTDTVLPYLVMPGVQNHFLTYMNNKYYGNKGLVQVATPPTTIRAVALNKSTSGGPMFSAIIGTDNIVYGSGSNGSGQLANVLTNLTSYTAMTGLPGGAIPIDVCCGNTHTAVLLNTGEVYYSGYIGVGATLNTLTLITGLPVGVTITRISASGSAVFGVGSNKIIYYIGVTDNATVETAGVTWAPIKTQLPNGLMPVRIEAGAGCVLVIGNNGAVYGRGNNAGGKLTGTAAAYEAFTPLTGLPNGVQAVDVHSGLNFVLVTGSDGVLYHTGVGAHGQGTGTSNRTTLTPCTGVASGKYVHGSVGSALTTMAMLKAYLPDTIGYLTAYGQRRGWALKLPVEYIDVTDNYTSHTSKGVFIIDNTYVIVFTGTYIFKFDLSGNVLLIKDTGNVYLTGVMYSGGVLSAIKVSETQYSPIVFSIADLSVISCSKFTNAGYRIVGFGHYQGTTQLYRVYLVRSSEATNPTFVIVRRASDGVQVDEIALGKQYNEQTIHSFTILSSGRVIIQHRGWVNSSGTTAINSLSVITISPTDGSIYYYSYSSTADAYGILSLVFQPLSASTIEMWIGHVNTAGVPQISIKNLLGLNDAGGYTYSALPSGRMKPLCAYTLANSVSSWYTGCIVLLGLGTSSKLLNVSNTGQILWVRTLNGITYGDSGQVYGAYHDNFVYILVRTNTVDQKLRLLKYDILSGAEGSTSYQDLSFPQINDPEPPRTVASVMPFATQTIASTADASVAGDETVYFDMTTNTTMVVPKAMLPSLPITPFICVIKANNLLLTNIFKLDGYWIIHVRALAAGATLSNVISLDENGFFVRAIHIPGTADQNRLPQLFKLSNSTFGFTLNNTYTGGANNLYTLDKTLNVISVKTLTLTGGGYVGPNTTQWYCPDLATGNYYIAFSTVLSSYYRLTVLKYNSLGEKQWARLCNPAIPTNGTSYTGRMAMSSGGYLCIDQYIPYSTSEYHNYVVLYPAGDVYVSKYASAGGSADFNCYPSIAKPGYLKLEKPFATPGIAQYVALGFDQATGLTGYASGSGHRMCFVGETANGRWSVCGTNAAGADRLRTYTVNGLINERNGVAMPPFSRLYNIDVDVSVRIGSYNNALLLTQQFDPAPMYGYSTDSFSYVNTIGVTDAFSTRTSQTTTSAIAITQNDLTATVSATLTDAPIVQFPISGLTSVDIITTPVA